MRWVRLLGLWVIVIGVGLVGSSASLGGLAQSPRELTVCLEGPPTCDFDSIPAALEAAEEGDTVLVKSGKYEETLRIDKPLMLQGADPAQTIIDGGGADRDVVTVAAEGVTVEGFTIKNGRDGVSVRPGAEAILRNNRLVENGRDGVLVAGVAELLGNLIVNNGGCGVRTFGSQAEVTGRGNLIRDNRGGDLCGQVPKEIRAVGGPPPPTLRVSPEGWTNQNAFTIEWEVAYPAAIAAVWVKFEAAPEHPEDGRRLAAERPLRLESPREGQTPVWIWLEDELGQKNHRNAAQATLLLDQSPPQITAQLEPEPNEHGWNNTDVTVRFLCRDQEDLSGLARCSEPVQLTEEGRGQKVQGEALDRAGNRVSVEVEVNLDKTPPRITAGEPEGERGENDWFISDVRVPFTAEDALSGLETPAQASFVRTSQGEGAEIFVSSGPVFDRAGNRAEIQVGPFKVDKTPPRAEILLEPRMPDGQNGWYVHPVSVRYLCKDRVSGLDPETPCPSPETLDEDGVHRRTLSVRDRAGHVGRAELEVRLDQTPPAVDCDVPDPDIWYAEDVTIPCVAEDAASGLADPSEAEFVLRTIGEGEQVFTGSRIVADRAGNTTRVGPYTFKIDKTPPRILPELTPSPNSAGWNNTDVTVSFRCEDTLSGVVSCPDPIRLTEEGQVEIRREVMDRAGNEASVTVKVNIDKTSPEIRLGEPQGDRGKEGWYRSDVTVPFTATDNLSGFPNGGLRIEGQARTSGEGWDRMVRIRVEDRAGNAAEAEAGPFQIDQTPPRLSIRLDPSSPNGRSGWYVSPVKMEYVCEDSLSGLDPETPCPASETLEADGVHELSLGPIRDLAGNEAARITREVKLDQSPPRISCEVPDRTRWYNRNVEVPCIAEDITSGLASSRDRQFTLVARGEGSQVRTDTRTVRDKAGNGSTVGPYTFKIDKTAPEISADRTPSPNAQGWNRTAVTVTFRCEDTLSGIQRCASPITVSTEGAGQRIEGEAVDEAGNRSTLTVTINLDRTPPRIFATLSPSPNEQGWNNTNVTVRFHCEDALSGIARCSSPVTVRTEGANQPMTGEALDKADNRSSTTITVNIDKSPPVGTLFINEGAATTTRLLVTLSWDARDPGGSGLAWMRFSNDGSRWSDWEPFRTQRANWDLSAAAFGGTRRPGPKTVYGQLKDNAGNVSRPIRAEIVFQPLVGNPLFVTSNGASFPGPGNGTLVKIDISNPLIPVKTEIVRRLDRPADAVCGLDKRIYFADWASGAVYRVDPDGRNLVELADLRGPEGVAFSPSGDLFISAEDGLWRLRGGTGPMEQVAPPFASGTGFLNGSGGLAFLTHGPFAGDLLAVDTAGNRVLRFPAPDYNRPIPFITQGLDVPIGIAINSRGEIFVSNFNSKKIQIYSSTGEFLGTLGERIRLRPFRPIHMEFGPDDTLYLAQWGDFVGQGWVARITDEGLQLIMALVDAWGIAIC